MADAVSTFKAVCRGGLNTGSDVLSLGEQSSGAAIQLVNYEPNLEGGYRRLSGFANNMGSVTGTGSVLGVCVANGIQQGIFGARTPSSGANYLHHWNFYFTIAVTSGQGTNLSVGETVTAVVSSSDATLVSATGTVKIAASALVTIDFGFNPPIVFSSGNVITGATSGGAATATGDAARIGWTEITSDLIADDPDGVSASASISLTSSTGVASATIGGALAVGGAVNFTTASGSEQPRKVTITAGGNESGRTFTITGTDYLGTAIVEALVGPNNSTVSSIKYFNTVTSISVSTPTQVVVKAGGNESGRTYTVTGTDSVDEVLVEELTGPNNSTTTSTKFFKTVTKISVDAATAGDVLVGTAGDDNGISVAATSSEAEDLTLGGALQVGSTNTVSFGIATAGAVTIGSGAGQYRPANPTMTGVAKVRFEKINFGTPKVVLTDGINPAATYDGTNFIQITTGIGGEFALSAPSMSAEFQNHLFLAGDSAKASILTFSAPTVETDFNPANGANELNVGFEIIAIKKFRNVLYIFGTNNIKRLVGNNSSDFRLETVTSNLGCLATDSVVELGGDLLFLSPDGIRPIGGTNKIGDVNLETISKNIQSTVKNMIVGETLTNLSSVIIRSKSQFRYMFSTSGSAGIIGALREYQGNYSFEFGQLSGIECTCADSGYIGQTEFVIHGASTGKVFQQESGDAFDTSNILSIYKTPFVYMDNPEQRKNYYSTATYMSAEGNFSIALGVSYDYENTDISTPDNLNMANTSPGAFFDSGSNIAVYDTTDIYDGNPSPVESVTFSGSGKSISFVYVTDDTNPSHSIQGYTITYGLGDVR
ncbi:CsoS2 family carboxysome shell protein [Flavobacteriaceae bacterium]|nr:CsoS2 family carboxysome shell protein [Flavobacteriaceae bacterium]